MAAIAIGAASAGPVFAKGADGRLEMREGMAPAPLGARADAATSIDASLPGTGHACQSPAPQQPPLFQVSQAMSTDNGLAASGSVLAGRDLTVVPMTAPSAEASAIVYAPEPSIAWRTLFRDSFTLLVVQQAWRIVFEDGTRRELMRGPFWDEYIASVKNLCCWSDGDKISTNYLFHPAMGSTAAFVFANNHRASQEAPFGTSGRYWKAKGAQTLFSTVYSFVFEFGPISEASIGNVGMHRGHQTYADVVITPGLGALISVGEDAARRYIIDRVKPKNLYWGNTLALLLNPTRSVANVMSWRRPWRGPAWSERSVKDAARTTP